MPRWQDITKWIKCYFWVCLWGVSIRDLHWISRLKKMVLSMWQASSNALRAWMDYKDRGSMNLLSLFELGHSSSPALRHPHPCVSSLTESHHWLSLKCPAYRKQIMRLPASINIRASVQFSRSIVSDTLWPCGLQHTRPSCPSSTPGVDSSSCPLSQWCHPTTSSSSPALSLSQHQGLFKWVISLHQVAKVLEFQLQHQSFQWTPRTDL